ncbi:MAG: DMT family transporter [Clostridiales bacterium]|nr:DMT family transporter [Clostridiales bacterium]
MTRQGGGMRQGYLSISICVFGVSVSPLFFKPGYLTGLHPLWLNVFRLLITVLVMTAVTFFTPKYRRAVFSTSKRAFWLSVLAYTLLAFHLNGWALALQYTDTFAASTILGTYLLLTVLFASLFLKERTSKAALAGLIIATAGVVVCNLGGGFGRLSGNLFAVFAAATEALYVLCGRKVRREMGAVPYTAILYLSTLLWMVVMAPFAGVPASLPSEGVLWAGMLAIFSTLLGHSIANVALKYFKAATVSAVMMSGVITGPLIVLLFLRDPPTLFTGIVGTVILVSIAWYIAVERREKRIAEQTKAAIAESITE